MPNYYGQYPYYPIQPNAYPTQTNATGIQPQVQDGGFVSVRNEMEARNYPVGLGKSVTFKDENAPYIYTKTMGFSQLDSPIFDKYKLVKEMPAERTEMPQNGSENDSTVNSTLDRLKGEIEAIWDEINGIKDQQVSSVGRKTPAKRKEVDDE